VYFNSGGKTPGEWGHAVCKVSSNWVEPTEFQACSRGLIVDNAQGCEEFARNTPGKVWAGAGAWPNDVGPGCEISSDLSSVYFNSGGKTPGEWGHAVCREATNWVEPTEFQACSNGLIVDNAQDCEEFARNTPGKVWAGAGAWPNDVGPGCEISSDLSSVYFNSGGKTPGEWGHAVCKA